MTGGFFMRNKRYMKKGIAALLATAIMAGLVTGCGSDSGADSKSDASSQQEEGSAAQNGSAANDGSVAQDSGEESSGGAYADYSNGFPDTVTIQIPVYDRAFEGWNVTDNYYTRWIQSEFGDKYNIKVEYVAIGRSTEVQDYMQLIAAKNHYAL